MSEMKPMKRSTGGIWIAWLLAGAVMLGAGVVPMDDRNDDEADAAPPAPVTVRDAGEVREEVLRAAEALGDEARALAEPLEEGESRRLQAVVMSVTGRAQWRPDAEAAWRNAEVDDVLDSGAMIRTGGRAGLILRVGKNATIQVDRNTRLTLPEIVQDGATLRTRAGIERGRADFKVDEIGLTNDFTVTTPSTTLAVRGTGFGMRYGGLDGTQVVAARTNEMASIELTYFLSRVTVLLSGAAISSDRQQNPVLAALFQTVGPPRAFTAALEDTEMAEDLAEAFERNPIVDQRQVDVALASVQDTFDLPIFTPPPVDGGTDFFDSFDPSNPFAPGGGEEIFTLLVGFICQQLTPIFESFETGLINAELVSGMPEQFGQTFSNIMAICDASETYSESDWIGIFDQVINFCQSITKSPEQSSLCINIFGEALVEQFESEAFEQFILDNLVPQ